MRIAHLLCEFATRVNDAKLHTTGGDYKFPMTQEQLGDATGLTNVHVNRMLKQLDRAGVDLTDLAAARRNAGAMPVSL